MFTFNSKEQPSKVVESPCADTSVEHDPNLITDIAEIDNDIIIFVRQGINAGIQKYLQESKVTLKP